MCPSEIINGKKGEGGRTCLQRPSQGQTGSQDALCVWKIHVVLFVRAVRIKESGCKVRCLLGCCRSASKQQTKLWNGVGLTQVVVEMRVMRKRDGEGKVKKPIEVSHPPVFTDVG